MSYTNIGNNIFIFNSEVNNELTEIKVEFKKFENEKLRQHYIPQKYINLKNYYIIEYTVGGEKYQFKRSNIKDLIKIIGEIIYIFIDFIYEENPDVIYFMGNSKSIYDYNINQKNNLYSAFIKHNKYLIPHYKVTRRKGGFLITKND